MKKPELLPKQLYEFDASRCRDTFGLINSYDINIHVPGVAKIVLGRYSTSLLSKLRFLPRRGEECSVQIGAFCEAGEGSSFLVGGEHPNASLFNYTFGASCEFLRVFIPEEGLTRSIQPSNGIVIGDNVLISNSVQLFDGASVGSGVVIAAGAIVVSECAENTICGGVPARAIKPRFSAEKLENYQKLNLPYIRAHSLANLPALIDRYDRGECSFDDVLVELEYMPRRPLLSVKGGINANGEIGIGDILGFSIGAERVEDPAAIQQLTSYFSQFYKPAGKMKWTPDIFHLLGLS